MRFPDVHSAIVAPFLLSYLKAFVSGHYNLNINHIRTIIQIEESFYATVILKNTHLTKCHIIIYQKLKQYP